MSKIVGLLGMILLLASCASNPAQQAGESTWNGPWNGSDAKRIAQDLLSASIREPWNSAPSKLTIGAVNNPELKAALQTAFATSAPTPQSYTLNAQLLTTDSTAAHWTYQVTIHINNPQDQPVWTAVRIVDKSRL